MLFSRFLEGNLTVSYLCSTNEAIDGLALMEDTHAEEENLKSDEDSLGVIRGRVTYARGSVPLAEIRCRVAKTSTDSSAATTSVNDSSTPEIVNPEAKSTTTEPPEAPEIPKVPEEQEVLTSTTDLAGTYQFARLQPCTYEVTVTPPKGWNYKTEKQLFELKPGEVKVANFKIEPKPIETIFTGQVFDSNGLPAKGARVGGVVCSTSLEPVTIVTNSDGRFSFNNVVPGDRFVRVMLSGHVAELRDFSIDEGQTLSLNFNLRKAAHKIHGTITDVQGKPLIAELQLFEGGPLRAMVIQKTQTTAENGTFEFHVNAGQYSILAQSPGHEMGAWEGSISADQKADIQLIEFDPKRHTHPFLSPTEAREQGYPG